MASTKKINSPSNKKVKSLWISPYLHRCAGQAWQSYSHDFIQTGPGRYAIDLRNTIGGNPKAGFSFSKTKSDRSMESINKRYVVHGGQICLTIAGSNVHAYTAADVNSLGGDGNFPWRGKDKINKYPSSTHALFGFSPRFSEYPAIKSNVILDGRPFTR